MTIIFDLTPQIEKLFRDNGQEPSEAVKEAALVDLYRLERITHQQLTEALGLSRLEVDEVLKRHDVPIGLSVEEFRSELESLRRDSTTTIRTTSPPERSVGTGRDSSESRLPRNWCC